jgi:endonuclease-8
VTTDLIGPPACELLPEFARRALLARLGTDPLRRDFDPDRAREALRRRPRRSIGDALLDQTVLAGPGNIYRAEALFLAGIHPLRESGGVDDAEWDRLWRALRDLMRRGVAQSRIRTVRPGEPAHPRSGRGKDDAFYVYQEVVCRRCATPLDEFPLSARRMFACPRCQPLRVPAGPRRAVRRSSPARRARRPVSSG